MTTELTNVEKVLSTKDQEDLNMIQSALYDSALDILNCVSIKDKTNKADVVIQLLAILVGQVICTIVSHVEEDGKDEERISLLYEHFGKQFNQHILTTKKHIKYEREQLRKAALIAESKFDFDGEVH